MTMLTRTGDLLTLGELVDHASRYAPDWRGVEVRIGGSFAFVDEVSVCPSGAGWLVDIEHDCSWEE